MDLDKRLGAAIERESEQFAFFFKWIHKHMPPSFLRDLPEEVISQVAHSLVGLSLQEFVARLNFSNLSLVLTLDSPDADVRTLERFRNFGIKNYRSYASDEMFPGTQRRLRIATIFFTEFIPGQRMQGIDPKKEEQLKRLFQRKRPDLPDTRFKKLLGDMNPIFLRSMNEGRMAIALDLFARAQTRDQCQYELKKNKDWEETHKPSLQIVLAWRNVPKYNFLYRLAKMIYRHNLVMQKVNATYIDPYSKQRTLILSLGLHGKEGEAAWDACNLDDFLKELVMLKYFGEQRVIEETFVDTHLLSGNMGNFVKVMVSFVHQALVHVDADRYSFDKIQKGFMRHPELTMEICKAFAHKFQPGFENFSQFERMKNDFLALIDKLDTGNELNDIRYKNILRMGILFVDKTLKTNFYRNNKTAFSFRLDPTFLDEIPFNRKEKFPELPYAIFFFRGMYFVGFHVRFRDLSRGGLRTIFPRAYEQMFAERDQIFTECYNLAYTQQKKNKDIPEGGSKGVILLEPYERQSRESDIYREELERARIEKEEIDKRVSTFHEEQRTAYLHQAQRSYIESFLTLINCEEDGTLRSKDIVDYYKKPEYIYLGPDENMHNEMIVWISEFAQKHGYTPGSSFISSKPGAGINHKEYGVTSFGVNVYVEEMLKYLGFDPFKDPFTIKISGGPDGDVAGNEILNLHKYYPSCAKLLALTDGSGTIYDPEGLDLVYLTELFHQSKAIAHYPPEKLHDGGFLLDLNKKKEESAYTTTTLLYKKEGSAVKEEWIAGNEMNKLFRSNVHQTVVDIFVPAGGRPRTLSNSTVRGYLKEDKPTSKAIVEGANLYLTDLARAFLEEKGVLIIKDSSANKGGVICSSFEVLCGLILTEEEFIEHKDEIMKEVLEKIRLAAHNEVTLLLKTHQQTKERLTILSEKISEKINQFTDEIFSHLKEVELKENDPFAKVLFNYCPNILTNHYRDRIFPQIPDVHKKAIIASAIASKTVYEKGLRWAPTIVDILSLIRE